MQLSFCIWFIIVCRSQCFVRVQLLFKKSSSVGNIPCWHRIYGLFLCFVHSYFVLSKKNFFFLFRGSGYLDNIYLRNVSLSHQYSILNSINLQFILKRDGKCFMYKKNIRTQSYSINYSIQLTMDQEYINAMKIMFASKCKLEVLGHVNNLVLHFRWVRVSKSNRK